ANNLSLDVSAIVEQETPTSSEEDETDTDSNESQATKWTVPSGEAASDTDKANPITDPKSVSSDDQIIAIPSVSDEQKACIQVTSTTKNGTDGQCTSKKDASSVTFEEVKEPVEEVPSTPPHLYKAKPRRKKSSVGKDAYANKRRSRQQSLLAPLESQASPLAQLASQMLNRDRCKNCGQMLETYDEETVGLGIVCLSSFVNREPSLAAPYLLEMLMTATKIVSNPFYSWNVELFVYPFSYQQMISC
ncbi:Protein unc-79, partial [Cichlidogyrus casuarinus]